MKPKTLHLHVSKYWHDLLKSGAKTTEYRADTSYWGKRLRGKHYDRVSIMAGYCPGAALFFEVLGIEPTREPNDLGLEKVWAIRLGRRIEP